MSSNTRLKALGEVLFTIIGWWRSRVRQSSASRLHSETGRAKISLIGRCPPKIFLRLEGALFRVEKNVFGSWGCLYWRGALIRVPTVAIILSEDRFAETRNFDCRRYGQMVFCLLRNK